MAFGFFRNRDEQFRAPAPVSDMIQSATPTVPMTDKLAQELDTLAVKVRKAGNDIPTAVYSKLRVIDDVLRSLLKYIAVQGCSAEQEFFLHAMVTDYIPNTLDKYLQLSPVDKGDDTPSAILLMNQFDTLEDKARNLAEMVRSGAIAELSTQAYFIDSKFASQT
jgi:hypothetical protein